MKALAALAAGIVGVAAAASPATAEKLTVAVSMPEVQITSNFTGAPIAVFGVIEATGGAAPAGDYQVAVVLLGPSETVIERRKDRIAGIWVNHDARTIAGAPSFYAIDATAPLESLAQPALLQRLQLGFDNLDLGAPVAADPQGAAFRDAYIQLKQKAKLYDQRTEISFIGPLIFRTNSFLPANVPVGRYSVLAYLFSGGQLVAHAEDSFTISKSGWEGSVASFARGQSLVYGLLSAGLALFIGWAGGVIFRRD